MTSSAKHLRGLPSVEILLRHPALAAAGAALPRPLLVEAARDVLAAERAALRGSEALPASADALAERAVRRANESARPRLRRVLNATGVVLHTNLGRAPLAPAARAAVDEVTAGYCSLEYDLVTGRRGDRGAGIERWLTRLTGAESALAVNNGAAAVLLALTALAAGREVLVSRGELVEIGGSFRIPEILGKSGAVLIEVGTTNRTHLADYERAFGRRGRVAAILRVHPSNFRIAGFAARPELKELCALAHRKRVPVIEDLGSGALVDLAAVGREHEPTVSESLAAGADIVTCSGDKLLGGAQAGLVVGRRRWIGKLRRDPLARALRPDKLALAVLEATLPLYADPARAAREVPVLAMLALPPEELEIRARRLANAIASLAPVLRVSVVRGEGEVGGGALPLERLSGWVVEIEQEGRTARELEALARAADPPVVGIIRAGRFRLDPRTLAVAELDEVAGALGRAFSAPTQR